MPSLFARAAALGLIALGPSTAFAQSACPSRPEDNMCPPPSPGKSMTKPQVDALVTRFASEEREIAIALKTSRADRCQQASAIARAKGRIDILAQIERRC